MSPPVRSVRAYVSALDLTRVPRMSFVVLLLLAARGLAADPAPQSPPAAEVRANFLKLLDRPRVDPAPIIGDVQFYGPEGPSGVRISIATEKKADGSFERVPILLVQPKEPKGRLPVVIVLHGTGGNKESQLPFLKDLAAQGMIGVAIDARFHGERSGGAKGAEAYIAAITRAWKTPAGQPQEHPFYFDTCWDLWRTIDYLQTRHDVDPERIGMIGFSMGGIQTWLAAAVDERVKVAVPAISVQSFRWSLENGQWQGRARTIGAAHQAAAADLGETEVNARVCRELWNKVIPGMLDQFDCPSMIRLFAGRPLLVLNGELDPNCPLGGAKLAFESAEAAFKEAGASDKLRIDVAAGTAHKVTDEQRDLAVNWFHRWLAFPWNMAELRKPPQTTLVDPQARVTSLLYTGEPYRGKPTQVFAWLARPEKIEGRARAMVLVHGGGGTAFKEWAELWAARGYVALAMDLAGRGDERKPLPDGGPDQTDAEKFGTAEVRDMWTYHAVADVIRGISLLAARDDVDPAKIGITGISWGGYLTCIVSGLDDRLKVSVPVYGCGFLHQNSAWLKRLNDLPAGDRGAWVGHWDPSQYVGGAKMPVLFVNGTNDFAYPLDSYQKTYRLVRDRELCVTVNMPHGHPQGWAPVEIGLFVDQHLRGGKPLPKITSVRRDGSNVQVTFESATPVASAAMHFTKDTGEWQMRQWTTIPARITDKTVTAEIPPERPLVYFVTLTDDRRATVSTEHEELK